MSEINQISVAKDYSKFVPFTARMMAAMRARESIREDRLFDDPFAATLAGSEAFQQVDQQLKKQDQAYVAVRTRFFDDFLSLATARQVVILASGLDSRAYRLPWMGEVDVYELDYVEVLAYKDALLKNTNMYCKHHLIACDLTQSWEEKLLAAGFCPQSPSVWLIEGLLMYLSEAQVHALLQSVSNLSTHGSELGVDLISVKSLEYEPYKGYFRFGCDTPEELLAHYGWQALVTQPGDEGANFGRYVEQSPPREIPNVMRAFLVKAKKQDGQLQ
ncbi:S-adenosyl-L-methionine-dependent methyltransferase [Dulcicalothrix desertica PCC 7102]|uniref:S-adenosyl-L-methionine-dependent methyltransferase n=1 Tax=Dulcicalothrix desertica PCC 7102 TaxID=232991 RepID=A0A3S1AK62_9CYAN|nr:SAM-dependent methyltransferase [Dulcicalothrix desertica]RUS93942.1 S-adenosyl-L-methionine-dependent methyltransferase [Dulcicalothrix desertica PCC 7102]TWH62708.1 methyltransferase (TIGR00027 family) [Dulcicalothrix desertica PCC 7102]